MSKKILKRSLVMSALMAFVIVGNGFAADFSFKTVETENVSSNGNKYYKIVLTPDGSWVGPIYVSGGTMWYPAGYRDNKLELGNIYYDRDYVENIEKYKDRKGLDLAAGFYELTEEEYVAYGNKDDNYVEITNNHISVESKNIHNPKGFIELVSGYISKYAYGKVYDNSLNFKKVEIDSTGSLLLFAAFANNSQIANIENKCEKVELSGNRVEISDSKINLGSSGGLNIIGGLVRYGKVIGNSVKLVDTVFKGDVSGGHIDNAGDALANLITMDGTVSEKSVIYGGFTEAGQANKNEVTILSADLRESSIYGGGSKGAYSDSSGNLINGADSNVININGSKLNNCSIYGGYNEYGNAVSNIVNITNANLQGSELYGGYSKSGGNISGNTLNLGANITGKLNTIGGFSAINFENIDWKHGKNIIETENLELVNTDIIIKNITGDPKVNDYMNLIVSDNQIVGSLTNQGEQTVKVSVAQVVKTTTGTLEQEPNIIKFTIIGSELNPQVGALADASVVANAFVANGTGLVEDSINAMMCEERIGYKTFAQLHGSNLDFDTNNNLSVQGWSGIVGVGETTKDRLTYGVFFETGEGDYNTFAKQNEGYVRGYGEVDYNGGGVLVRKDYENGIYTEASLRAGRMNNEVRDAVVDSSNKLNGFDISSTYYGAHIGVGKIIPRGEKESLDIYGKFLYSHHDGESFVIDGDTFNMDSVNSQRLRVGFRYNELNGSKLRMYYGAAYEYEFDGAANNTVLDYNFSAPDLGGSTIVGELGLHYNADAKWCFDLNVRGYAGQREGFTGSVQANYLF